MIRALIAEDEPAARRHLAALVTAEPDFALVGEAPDGLTAATLIEQLAPDVVFLDVRMPGLSGTEVLERCTHNPVVVFTTAYDEYALAAFELAAVDYLLKPFGPDRFRMAVERVRRLLATPTQEARTVERVRAALEPEPLTRIFVRDGSAIRPLPAESVVRFEARDDYVAAHANGRSYLLSITLQRIHDRLDPARFARVHRSHIINLDHVVALHAHDANRMTVEMRDGSKVVASRSGTQRLRNLTL